MKPPPYVFVFICLCIACSIEPCSTQSVLMDTHKINVLTDKVCLEEAYEMASLQTKGISSNIIVEPVIDAAGDTLMYLVNYSEGWKILSADKRTPAVIAQGESGYISFSTENCGLLSWLWIMAADMKHIIHCDDSNLNFTEDQIKSHRHQWVKEPMRFQGDSLPIIPFHEGEWELQSVWTSEVYYDEVNHMVDAHWDQTDPYNYYCPPKDYGDGNKPAGCAPVACGELLHFLCYHLNIPFEFEWNNLSGNISEVDTMYHFLYCPTDKSPLLLRYLGDLLGADYTDTGSGVTNSLTKVQQFYYDSLGINSTKQTYSINKVKQNLLEGIPIMVSASSGPAASLNPDSPVGHSFIIDGYQRTLTMYQHYYTRLFGYPPILEEKIDTSYSSPHISFIKMNWGWWTQWFVGTNDGWYALTGEWYVNIDNDPEPDRNYYGDIDILCDFYIP